ncbi:unnamed protein product [Coccothraustes coccothraustes]
MRGKEGENVLLFPGQTSNDRQSGHHSLHTLRPPCPSRPSRVPELRRATGALAGLGCAGMDTAVRASVRRRKDGIRAGRDASLRPCSLLSPGLGAADRGCTAHALLPRNSPRQMGLGVKTAIVVPVFYRNPPARGGCSLRALGAGSPRPSTGGDGNIPPGSGTPLGNPIVEGTREVTKHPSGHDISGLDGVWTDPDNCYYCCNSSDTVGIRC